MLDEISKQLSEIITNFSENDQIVINNKISNINAENFVKVDRKTNRSIAFIDGGQANILTSGNFNLSFVRVCAVVFSGQKKIEKNMNEFYLFTKAIWKDEIFFESKIFPLGEKLLDEIDLYVSANDATMRNGIEGGKISGVTNMARRLAELALAKKMDSDFILLDGTLEKTFRNEEKFLTRLDGVGALAKSSSLFTISGNSPVVLLNKIGPTGCWAYNFDDKTAFVKLHQRAKHVFRFEGSKEIISYLVENCQDALFLGYPYGLLMADKLARVSNQERSSLIMKFLLKEENRDIADYLNTSNAHDILDNLG
jgi:hypothetical protein